MTSHAVRILWIEDSSDDFELGLRELERAEMRVEPRRVADRAGLIEALDDGRWDLVLADNRLPDLSAVVALRLVRHVDPEVPFVVVSGTIPAGEAVELMRNGARDYLAKSDLHRLVPVVERELLAHRETVRGRLVQAALADSEERYDALSDTLPLGVFVVDDGRRIVYANPAARSLIAAPGPDLPEAPFEEFFDETDRTGIVGWLDETATGSAASVKLASLEGGSVRLELTASRLHSARTLLTAQDVTSRHAMEQLKSNFLAVVSHELRTPLTVISGYAQLLGLPAHQAPADVAEISTRILERTAHMSRLVENLLDVAEMETFGGEERGQANDVRGIVARCVELAADEDHQMELTSDDGMHVAPEALRSADGRKLIPPLYGALLKNEQDVHLLERLAFIHRRDGK